MEVNTEDYDNDNNKITNNRMTTQILAQFIPRTIIAGALPPPSTADALRSPFFGITAPRTSSA